MTLAPGSPSPFRPKNPPSFARYATISFIVGMVEGTLDACRRDGFVDFLRQGDHGTAKPIYGSSTVLRLQLSSTFGLAMFMSSSPICWKHCGSSIALREGDFFINK